MKLSQLLFVAGILSSSSIYAAEQISLAGIDELGRYINAVLIGQRIVYNMLGYCVQELPEKKEQFNNAKAQWDARNLPMVNSIKDIEYGWFTAAGTPSESIQQIVAAIDPYITAASKEPNKLANKGVAAVAALQPAERKEFCEFYIGHIIGGRQDIQVFFPFTKDFYRKYALIHPSPSH